MVETAVSTRDDAVARAERIRTGIRALAELQQDITDAYHARDWSTLGYDTWEAYVAGEFGGTLPKLDRGKRRDLVVSLRAEGLSTRAIAAATGTDDRTVRRDIAGAANAAPDAEPIPEPPVTGLDGKTYTPKPHVTDLISPDDVAELNALPSPVKPEPEKRRRRPLVDAAHEVSRQLLKEAERFQRLLADDRLRKNRGQVTEACAGDLNRAAALINAAINHLQNEG